MYSPLRYYPFHSFLVDDSLSSWSRSWRSIIAELLGTMLFTFASGTAVVATNTLTDSPAGAVLLVALASGFAYMALVFNFWNLSGGHLNPCVTWATLISRRIGACKGVAYLLAQFAGGMLGGLLVLAATPQSDQGFIGSKLWNDNLSSFSGYLLETLVSFLLVHTFFATAFDSVGMGRLAPLAIGLVQTFSYLLTWRFTGPCANPARLLGIAVVTGQYHHLWVYLSAPFVGSTLATLLYIILFGTRHVNVSEADLSSFDGEYQHLADGSKSPARLEGTFIAPAGREHGVASI